MLQLMGKDNSLTFSPVYNQVLNTAEWTGASWRERKCPSFESAAKGIRTRALSIESLTFYSAPQKLRWMRRVTRTDKIRNEHIRGTTRVAQASKKVTERQSNWYGM